jgi:hypothetical protein
MAFAMGARTSLRNTIGLVTPVTRDFTGSGARNVCAIQYFPGQNSLARVLTIRESIHVS